MKKRNIFYIGFFAGLIACIPVGIYVNEVTKEQFERSLWRVGFEYENDFEKRLMSLPSIDSELYTASAISINICGDILNIDSLHREIKKLCEENKTRLVDNYTYAGANISKLDIKIKQDNEKIIVTYKQTRPIFIMRWGAFTKVDQCIFQTAYEQPKNSTNEEIFKYILEFVDLRLKSFTKWSERSSEHREIFEKSKQATSYDHFMKEYLYEKYPGYGPIKLKKNS